MRIVIFKFLPILCMLRSLTETKMMLNRTTRLTFSPKILHGPILKKSRKLLLELCLFWFQKNKRSCFCQSQRMAFIHKNIKFSYMNRTWMLQSIAEEFYTTKTTKKFGKSCFRANCWNILLKKITEFSAYVIFFI